jgi:hypothetical protein
MRGHAEDAPKPEVTYLLGIAEIVSGYEATEVMAGYMPFPCAYEDMTWSTIEQETASHFESSTSSMNTVAGAWPAWWNGSDNGREFTAREVRKPSGAPGVRALLSNWAVRGRTAASGASMVKWR